MFITYIPNKTSNYENNKFEVSNPQSMPSPELRQAGEILLPPQPLIVYYGNGVSDTLIVTNHNFQQSADKVLFAQAVNNELNGDFTNAITKYQSLIQNYKDSATAINSMKKILYCYDRLNADTNSFSTLRNYYQNLVQNNATDTAMVKTGREMASKCFVRMHHFTAAISEYENVVSSSHDSLEILCAQLNIIETYMIMQNEGGNSRQAINSNSITNFTGRLNYLKPATKKDAIAMIIEKLHHIKRMSVKAQIPKVFSLSQNYPNPFNPTTTIKYSLPTDTKVVIKIYDILGKEVKTLVNDFKKAGFYQETFDGTNLASGVYFYHIEAGKFIQSKKMVLVK